MTDILDTWRTSRGLARFVDPVKVRHGGEIRVYESSAADSPHVWLDAAPTSHLAAADAWLLARQLMWLLVNHYQGDARPAGYRQYAVAALDAALAQTADTPKLWPPGWGLLDALDRLGYTVVRAAPGDPR